MATKHSMSAAERRAERQAERAEARAERQAERAEARAERKAAREERLAERAEERADRQAAREERRAERAEERAEKRADRAESIAERTVDKAIKNGIELAVIGEVSTASTAKAQQQDANTSSGLVEETPAFVSLAGLASVLRGPSNFVLTIQLSADTGTFESEGNDQVQVDGSGTGTVNFTGRLGDLRTLFQDTQMLTYTGAEDVSGEDAVTFTLSALFAGRQFIIERTSFDIQDTPEEPEVLEGTANDDTLIDTADVNALIGHEGDDHLDGMAEDDTIDGGEGNDDIRGGEGADIMTGGAGEDTLIYYGSDAGVTIDLNEDGSGNQSASGGHAEGDVISEFENVYGSDFADTVTGNAEDNVLFGYAGDDVIDGGAGNDVIRGGEGADTMTGGAGIDWLRYLGADAGVTVNLTLDGAGFHQLSGGEAEGDVASGFENVYGSDFDDVLTGDANANYLIGHGGDDTIDGGAGNDTIRGGAGADTLTGGAGTDWLNYDEAEVGVTVDLSLEGIAQTSAGDASGDILSGFENLSGTAFDDVLTGDDGRNTIYGLDGDDTINGGGGNDVIRGGTGADTLVGGAGSDVLQYAGSNAGVTINLNADENGFQQASGGDAEGDIISEFEHVYGSNFDDVMIGNDSRNILYGYSGNDTFDGGLGNDVLRGSAGSDTFVFSTELGAGNVDTIVDFASGDDVIHLTEGVFGDLDVGTLDAAEFVSVSGGLATTSGQRIIHDVDTGNIYFDSDGSGASEGIVFATVTPGTALDENDFLIV